MDPNENATTTTAATATITTSLSNPNPSTSHQSPIESLSSILPSFPPSLTTSSQLLQDPTIFSQISSLLRDPNSGAGDNPLCRWLYDSFHSSDPQLHLLVLRHIPLICNLYISRVPLRGLHPLAGFEAILLALYAHETTSRSGHAVVVTVPDLNRPSIYHETKEPPSTVTTSSELNRAIVSPGLEPYGTIRSSRRARIIGVAFELYYSKITLMPLESKLEFCEFCVHWAGINPDKHRDDDTNTNDDKTKKTESGYEEDQRKGQEGRHGDNNGGGVGGKVMFSWEILQPVLRILGHCLLGLGLGQGRDNKESLHEKACEACRCLHARALHDIDARAISATRSLLRSEKMSMESKDEVDHTEMSMPPNVVIINY